MCLKYVLAILYFLATTFISYIQLLVTMQIHLILVFIGY